MLFNETLGNTLASMNSNIAVVIGATGLVGSELVKQLVTSTGVDQVVTLTRTQSNDASSKVVNHVVDFDNPESFADLVRGQWLFSAMGTTLKTAGSIEAQRRVDHDYQLWIAELAAKNGIEHYLLVSSAMARASAGNAYLAMKGELEDRVLALPLPRISIFRPGPLDGPRKENRIGEQVLIAVCRVLGVIPGLRRWQPIHARQVAAKMVRVSQSQGPARQIIEPLELFEP